MNDQVADKDRALELERVMRGELSRGDLAGEAVLPVLRHLVSAEDNSLFSDEILARVRGMIEDLARQLVEAVVANGAQGAGTAALEAQVTALVQGLVDCPEVLAHVHALALEWQLTEKLQGRLALDPVVSPLVQALIASSDAETQDGAMRFLAAQARWCQAQRRMRLPLSELPGDVFHAALGVLRSCSLEMTGWHGDLDRLDAEMRERRDEGASRLALAAQLVSLLGGGVQAALSIGSAGLALFLTALALASGQARDGVVYSTHESRMARLALALRAAGLKGLSVEREFLVLHPEFVLPEGFAGLGVDQAAALLAGGGR